MSGSLHAARTHGHPFICQQVAGLARALQTRSGGSFALTDADIVGAVEEAAGPLADGRVPVHVVQGGGHGDDISFGRRLFVPLGTTNARARGHSERQPLALGVGGMGEGGRQLRVLCPNELRIFHFLTRGLA